jgi:hypothetical protein
MAYVSESRLPPNTQYAKTYTLGVQDDFKPIGTRVGLGTFTPVQVTTGWRTGRVAQQLDDSHDAALFDVDSVTKFYNYLEADEAHYSAQSDFDTGHEFDTLSKEVICTPDVDVKFGGFGSSTPYRYHGPLYCDPGYSPVGAWYNADAVNTAYYGPRAIQACAPTHPLVSLAVDLAEFKSEGARVIGSSLLKHAERGKSVTVPQFKTKINRRGLYKEYRKRDRLKQGRRSAYDIAPISSGANVVAEEWLNWQFGLNPIMQDAKKVLNNLLDSQRLLAQYQANSGKITRRSFHFPLQRDTVFEDNAGNLGRLSASSPTSIPNDYMFVAGNRYGVRRESVVRTVRIWFDGGFTYYLQPDVSLVSDLDRREQQINYLLGTRVTPEVLWNLQPWSWLVDWNLNIGTNIANAERLASDGLVMKYGYLMCETTIDHSIVIENVPIKGTYQGPFTTLFRTTRRQRVKASPFGFSIVPGSFSARQWSILGALGYTKSPQSLKTV